MAVSTDNFDRSNGGLGSNWTTAKGIALVISSNRVASGGAGSDAVVLYNVASFGADMYARAVLTYAPSGNHYLYVLARCSALTSSFDGYGVVTNGANYYIQRYDDGESTDILTSNGSNAFTSGDILEIACSGSTIGLYRTRSGSRTLINSTTDATYSAGGYGGLGSYEEGSLNELFDDFEVGDLGGGGGSNLLAKIMTSGLYATS